jgi:hypothetical protein
MDAIIRPNSGYWIMLNNELERMQKKTVMATT